MRTVDAFCPPSAIKKHPAFSREDEPDALPENPERGPLSPQVAGGSKSRALAPDQPRADTAVRAPFDNGKAFDMLTSLALRSWFVLASNVDPFSGQYGWFNHHKSPRNKASQMTAESKPNNRICFW